MSSSKQQTCEERVERHMEERLKDLEGTFRAYEKGEEPPEDLPEFPEYGLGFWYNPKGTFSDQKEGFFVYQFSCGGPQEEIRFFADPDFELVRAEFWFLDWFDGAFRDVSDNTLVRDVWEWFRETGTVAGAFEAER